MASHTQIALITFTLIVYVIHLVFVGLAAEGENSLFPSSTSNVTTKYDIEFNMAAGARSVWIVNFVYVLIALFYIGSTIFRSGEAIDVLSTQFYVHFNLSAIFVIIWMFLFNREMVVGPFILIVIATIFLDLAFYQSLTNLHDFESTHDEATISKADHWCQRLLVQNGLLFNTALANVGMLQSIAIFFTYSLNVSSTTSSLIAVLLIAILAVGWFALENFAVSAYTDFTFTAYIALIWALSGVHYNVWGVNDTVAVPNLILLILCCLFFVLRIVVLVLRNAKKGSYENIAYDAEKQTVSS